MDKDERARRAAEQEARALAALEAIRAGGDVGRASQDLSNEFTDRHAARFSSWLRRLFRRPPRG